MCLDLGEFPYSNQLSINIKQNKDINSYLKPSPNIVGDMKSNSTDVL